MYESKGAMSVWNHQISEEVRRSVGPRTQTGHALKYTAKKDLTLGYKLRSYSGP